MEPFRFGRNAAKKRKVPEKLRTRHKKSEPQGELFAEFSTFPRRIKSDFLLRGTERKFSDPSSNSIPKHNKQPRPKVAE